MYSLERWEFCFKLSRCLAFTLSSLYKNVIVGMNTHFKGYDANINQATHLGHPGSVRMYRAVCGLAVVTEGIIARLLPHTSPCASEGQAGFWIRLLALQRSGCRPCNPCGALLGACPRKKAHHHFSILTESVKFADLSQCHFSSVNTV